jgi:surface carbohydrate biosynthesis protein
MNLEEKKVVFITTYKARDFQGNGLVGHYLKINYNIDSFFVHGYSVKKEILRIKPAVLVMDHLVWDHKKELAKWASSIGVKVVLLFTEGYYKDISSFDKIFGHPKASNLGVTTYCVWNERMIQRVKELNYSQNFFDIFKITGNPRFDFLTNNKLKNFGISKEEFYAKYNIEKFNSIITYMSTTPYQGYDFEKFHFRYKNKAKYSEEKIRSFYDDNQKQFKNHVTIIRDLALANPNICFFYKTHPSEAYISNYDKFFNGVTNIKLIINENVKPFLQFSDLVIQRNCTTALESWLLDKPVVQLDDDFYNSATYDEHLKYSYILKNFEEVDEFIKETKYNDWDNKDVILFLKGIFGELDGLSHERVAHQIYETIENWNEADVLNLTKNLNQYKLEDDNRLPNKIKDFLGLKRSFSLRPKVYFKRLLSKKVKKNTANEVNITEEEVAAFYEQLNKFI